MEELPVNAGMKLLAAIYQEAGLVYSDENVSKWLEEVVKPANTRQQYHVTARYMEQLREFIRTGKYGSRISFW